MRSEIVLGEGMSSRVGVLSSAPLPWHHRPPDRSEHSGHPARSEEVLPDLMGEAETEALDAGLVEAFSLLTTGGEAQLRATLQLVALTTLSTPAGAQLWASLLEVATTPVAEGSSFSVNGFVSALTNAVSAIAGAQLAASSFGP